MPRASGAVPSTTIVAGCGICIDLTQQFVGKDGTQEGDVDESAAEFLCDERHFDTRSAVAAQCPPTRRANRLLQTHDAFGVVEIRNRCRSEIGDELCRGVAQLLVAQRSDERP